MSRHEQWTLFESALGLIEDDVTGRIAAWLEMPATRDMTREQIRLGIYGGQWRQPTKSNDQSRVDAVSRSVIERAWIENEMSASAAERARRDEAPLLNHDRIGIITGDVDPTPLAETKK